MGVEEVGIEEVDLEEVGVTEVGVVAVDFNVVSDIGEAINVGKLKA